MRQSLQFWLQKGPKTTGKSFAGQARYTATHFYFAGLGSLQHRSTDHGSTEEEKERKSREKERKEGTEREEGQGRKVVVAPTVFLKAGACLL